MGTTTKAKALILATMSSFALVVMSNYYETVLNTGSKMGPTRIFNIVSIFICLAVMMIGLNPTPMGDIGIRGKGFIYAAMLLIPIIASIVITAKKWKECISNTEDYDKSANMCLEGDRVGFYVIAGLTILFLLMYISSKAYKSFAQPRF